MHYNEFVHHLFLHKDLDEYLIKHKKFIVTNFQRLIREKILVSFNNIDYVFNYYDDFYYKFFIAKIINEENPEYIMVAFDKGHNFRQDMYDNYKDGRIETPQDLKIQFKEAKEICTLLGIKYIECDNYEADDIIGTFARMADEDKNYNATIISSDKDLLQLISDEVNAKLLKQKD